MKNKLQKLADRDFYHSMKSGWNHEDFKISEEIYEEIKKVISELKKHGIVAKYRMGYDIEYKKEEI